MKREAENDPIGRGAKAYVTWQKEYRKVCDDPPPRQGLKSPRKPKGPGSRSKQTSRDPDS